MTWVILIGSNMRNILLITLLLGCFPVVADPVVLYSKVNDRLSLMRDVAAYKWHNNLPIEDKERERALLRGVLEIADRYGTAKYPAANFFRTQMEVAKEIQRYWFGVWKGAPDEFDVDSVPDLFAQTRPLLMLLGEEILEAHMDSSGAHDKKKFINAIDVAGIEPHMKNRLYDAILKLRLIESRIDKIKARGYLRVGTTFDYPPFSYRSNDGNTNEGSDIDMARDLASHIGVDLIFFDTTWPTLLVDLINDQFDIAMGGISVTSARSDVASFSIPYFTGGKTPIVRCSDVNRFGSLESIDRPGVRMVVNPGGTNEQYVVDNIEKAKVYFHEDNISIFQEIIEGRADVMVTDRIEVRLQTNVHGELCSSMEKNLNEQDKAYLLPIDARWKAYIDNWLGNRLDAGFPSEAMRRHLIPTEN